MGGERRGRESEKGRGLVFPGVNRKWSRLRSAWLCSSNDPQIQLQSDCFSSPRLSLFLPRSLARSLSPWQQRGARSPRLGAGCLLLCWRERNMRSQEEGEQGEARLLVSSPTSYLVLSGFLALALPLNFSSRRSVVIGCLVPIFDTSPMPTPASPSVCSHFPIGSCLS